MKVNRRRELLPIWMKIFIWFFMAFGAMAILALIWGFTGAQFNLAVYGLESTNPLSIIGIIIISIILLKGVAAFALWIEKDWAIILGQIDALMGIAICIFIMGIYPFIHIKNGFNVSFRLELLFLIPFYIKLIKIKKSWFNIPV